ncbi:tRNA adenosine(34) deaminase TadA [Crassaminicella profunda]|uniref:tRNA adenosine(34) deaminase TadA n=1 Tax=Crassaminicella profunda TaxID=1286698 RepID=UPI001CA6B8EB|nr:tRNA adenosine(34) deaminase TadA [Crassaminicella profunda]QZY54905.1 tRNA adenosine(34) deaminase TadA [Crassaminicella profunda]
MKEIYMQQALLEAKKAMEIEEVPIGAVIVRKGEIIARAHNLRETSKDPTSHAEILAIRKASEVLGGWRLTGCDLYVTVEPCPMCAGAIMLSRIDRLVIGTMDPKGGAVGSILNIVEDERFNHQTEVIRGIMQEECATMMKEFFRKLRKRK